jgi:hypothetical protein
MKCLVCCSKKKKFLFYNKDRLHLIEGKFKLVECQNCGLIMVDNPPKDISKYYPNDYHAYEQYKVGSLKERFAVFLYKLYNDTWSLANAVWVLPVGLLLYPLKHLLRGTRLVDEYESD